MSTVRILIDAAALHERIGALGREIRTFYGDEPIVCIGVLKGSFIFMADLVRAIGGDVRCAFLGVSSYEGTQSTGEVRITHDLAASIRDAHVLIVEDIVDTGLTLAYLRRTLAVRGPATLRVATLLDKPSRRKQPVDVEFVGFTIPDLFVVGFGLDLDEAYRNLPFVGVFDPES